jgi:hypothetical protein
VKSAAHALWHAYVHSKQTLEELEKKAQRSHVWVRKQLDRVVVPVGTDLVPQTTVIVPDTTFWGRHYGVVVFRSWTLKRNLWWNEVSSEKKMHYTYGRQILESQGWKFTAAVVDGRRGLAAVFKDIPVQMCHFHQMKIVSRYITRRPKTDAGKELWDIVYTLPRTDKNTFTKELTAWEKKWHDYIREKTYVAGTKHWYYTHKSVRGAYLSLATNLPYLFTYLAYPHLNIPNTTNTIDGYFSALKKKIHNHQGLRRDRRYKMISELLRNG